MNEDQASYLAYMLRLWLENDQPQRANSKQMVWRASLEDPHTREMQVFADLEALFEFLTKETKRRASVETARPTASSSNS